MQKNRKLIFGILCCCIIIFCGMASCSKDKEENGTGKDDSKGTTQGGALYDENADSDEKGELSDTAVKMAQTAFMVGDREVSYGEVILYMQSEVEKMEALYGSELWTLELDSSGLTVGESYKDELLKRISYVKIVCAQAESLNIALSEDELIDINLATEDFMSSLTDEQIERYAITRELVHEIYCDNMLANKVYEILTLNIDTSVTEDEVRNMVLQYVSISKFYRDANGKQLEYTGEELEEIKSNAGNFLEKARNMSLTSLTELEQDEYQITELVAGKDEMSEELSPELAGLAFGLRDGEFSDIYETDYGFYILFCAAESDEEATQNATIKILEERQKALFEDLYSEWELNTRIKVNWDVWDTLKWY